MDPQRPKYEPFLYEGLHRFCAIWESILHANIGPAFRSGQEWRIEIFKFEHNIQFVDYVELSTNGIGLLDTLYTECCRPFGANVSANDGILVGAEGPNANCIFQYMWSVFTAYRSTGFTLYALAERKEVRKVKETYINTVIGFLFLLTNTNELFLTY